MKLKFNKILVMALLVGSAILSACSDNAVVETPEVLEEVDEAGVHVATLTLKLPESGESRLAYEEGNYKGKNAILTKWEDDDKVMINFSPSNTANAYLFDLVDGAGTNEAVFQNSSMPNYNSNFWIMYYPGNKITCEKDYLNHSYLNQAQNGNGSMAHLSDYHTIRYDRRYETNTTFNDEIIDFSGDGFEESMCVKFNLELSQSITPTNLDLYYMNPSGAFSDIFYAYNYLGSYYNDENESYSRNETKLTYLSLKLQNFSPTKEVEAYMMLSNNPITVENGGKFRIYLTASDGKRYYGDVNINDNVTMVGGKLYTITCSTFTEAIMIDGFENSSTGVTYIQGATVTSKGADIIIMGDGFAADAFGENGSYQTVMEQAYEDFFSVEPFKSLKGYFNVYTINAVSEDNHDATPYSDNHGQNGATNGSAKTIFNTQFTPGTTSIRGNDNLALQYAMQAIRAKGGTNGAPITDENEVYRRARRALIMVMVNVEAHAGTCYKYTSSNDVSDFCEMYSVAYTALNNNEFARKWTTIHEAGGHGFGKLADEYGENVKDDPTTQIWVDLNNEHALGLNRNVDRYVSSNNASDTWPATNNDNVYWSSLVSTYQESEGLGCYEGANTYSSLYCRPTENSVMRNQFTTNGHFFNAISRWAIWYRLKRLSGANYQDFQSSLADFLEFDRTLSIVKDMSADMTSVGRGVIDFSGYKPLAPSVTIELP